MVLISTIWGYFISGKQISCAYISFSNFSWQFQSVYSSTVSEQFDTFQERKKPAPACLPTRPPQPRCRLEWGEMILKEELTFLSCWEKRSWQHNLHLFKTPLMSVSKFFVIFLIWILQYFLLCYSCYYIFLFLSKPPHAMKVWGCMPIFQCHMMKGMLSLQDLKEMVQPFLNEWMNDKWDIKPQGHWRAGLSKPM